MRTLYTYVITFNCARQLVNSEVFARHLLQALPSRNAPDLLVLCLQEIAPISYSFLGGSLLAPYFQRLNHAVQTAGMAWENTRYVNIVTLNVGMTALMIFVPDDTVSRIRWLETAGVGFGFYEMGNKGAVGARIGYAEEDGTVELSLVAAHLAPMEYQVERRNEDWKVLVERLVFSSKNQELPAVTPWLKSAKGDGNSAAQLQSPPNLSRPESGLFTPTSYLVLGGDLNYRTSSTKPSFTDLYKYPRPTEDLNDPNHYSFLLKADQLSHEMKAKRTCHGLQEAPITFPPTYKYSDKQRARVYAGTDDALSWDWANQRWPSWCDRILYLDFPASTKSTEPSAPSITVDTYTALPLMSTSDHRPVALALSIPLHSTPALLDQDTEATDRTYPPFEIDPQWRQKRAIARRKELVIGLGAYMVLTWEGNGIVLAVLLGALGGWAVIRGMLNV